MSHMLPRRIAATLALAFATTWGIATLMAWRISQHPPPHESLKWGALPQDLLDQSNDKYTGWLVSRGENNEAVRITSTWYDPGVKWGLAGGWPATSPEPLLPSWAAFTDPRNNVPSKATHHCIAVATGWPCLAIHGGMCVEWPERGWGNEASANSDYAPKLRAYSAFLSNEQFAIEDINGWQDVIVWPYGVLPIGFLANVAAFWLVFAIPCVVWNRAHSRK